MDDGLHPGSGFAEVRRYICLWPMRDLNPASCVERGLSYCDHRPIATTTHRPQRCCCFVSDLQRQNELPVVHAIENEVQIGIGKGTAGITESLAVNGRGIQVEGASARKRTESESKYESDFSGADLGVRSGRGAESPSPRRSPILLWILECESKEEPDLLWTGESESKEESDLLWTRGSESKEETDLLWTGEPDRVRSGKAFSSTGFIRPAFVWSVAEKGVVLMDSADL
jgi:hypothetical protein